MLTEAVSPAFAAQLELCEVNAWRDMYAAMPADFAHQFGLEIRQVQQVTLTRCRQIPFVHFNCVKNLGMNTPANEALVDELIAIYRAADVQSFTFYHIPHCQPPALREWFEERGFHAQGGWDRIYRNNVDLDQARVQPNEDFVVEKVTKATGAEWAGYIDTIYGLPTTPWLLALVGRPGWHHYLLRKGAEIVAVRTMYLHTDGMAWLGIDAPVPGLMAPSYELDLQLCRAIVLEGIALGARYFVGDIEAPTPQMDTPAYHNFAALGFQRPYFRSHYTC
ncbi:MAG: hypothetical protein DYG89_29255 [Caldilinea sp. CFX5]|nr:hypothetical protein [Caldilinea sp. CFX5]